MWNIFFKDFCIWNTFLKIIYCQTLPGTRTLMYILIYVWVIPYIGMMKLWTNSSDKPNKINRLYIKNKIQNCNVDRAPKKCRRTIQNVCMTHHMHLRSVSIYNYRYF